MTGKGMGDGEGPVLWSGAPAAAALQLDRRRWAVSLLSALGAAVWAVWVVRGLLPPAAWWQLAPVALFVFLPVLGMLLYRPSQREVDSGYTITEREVLVDRYGRTDSYPLASLGDLTLSLESGGLGTVRYTGPPRARVATRQDLLRGWIGLPPLDRGEPLLEHLAEPQSVFAILRAAQAAAVPAGGDESHADESPTVRPPSELTIRARSPEAVASAIFLLFVGAFWLLPRGIPTPWGSFESATLVLIGLGVALPVFAALTLARRGSARRLVAEGLITQGTIAELVEVPPEDDEESRWLVAYRYHDLAGRPYVGFGSPMPLDETQLWPVGVSVQVRYDPADPQRSIALRDPTRGPPRWPTLPATPGSGDTSS